MNRDEKVSVDVWGTYAMRQIVSCPSCSRQYQVAEGILGKRVHCPQCGTAFTVPYAGARDPLVEPDISQVPAAFAAHAPALAGATAEKSRATTHADGPTDARIRLSAVGLLAFSGLFSLGSVALYVFTGTVYGLVVGLVPLTLILGIAGLVSPNVLRSMGKYGGHLPAHYRWIGWGAVGVSVLLMIPLMIVMYQAGFRSTNVPRPKHRLRTTSPTPPVRVPSAPGDRVAAKKDVSASADSSTAMRRKSYLVSIAVPDHSVFVPADAKLRPGIKLAACYSGVWNPITTLSENADGSLNVRWDEWGPHFDCAMIRSELIIRREVLKDLNYPMASLPAVTPRPSTSATSSASDPRPAPRPLKSYPVTIAVPADCSLVPADARLPPGTKLQACYFGKWNPITLLAENDDGTLTVRWDDYGASFDCRMARGELIVANSTLRGRP